MADGIEYPEGTVVRATWILPREQHGQLSFTTPSMAELLYYQAERNLAKAEAIKSKSLRLHEVNSIKRLDNEPMFFDYLGLCMLGVLGLYSSLEAMVHELHTRNMDKKVIDNGKQIDLSQLSHMGFEKKISTVAAQLSGKSNIWGTKMMEDAKRLHSVRVNIQHWDQKVDKNYFMKMPSNHPIALLIELSPQMLALETRGILDHYLLLSGDDRR